MALVTVGTAGKQFDDGRAASTGIVYAYVNGGIYIVVLDCSEVSDFMGYNLWADKMHRCNVWPSCWHRSSEIPKDSGYIC